MGRPKGAKNVKAEPEPKQAEPAPSVSKAEMVRAALADGFDTPGDGVAFIKAKFGIDLPKPMWSSYRAQQKARDNKGTAKSKPGRKPRAAAPDSAAPPVQPGAKHGGGGETDLITAMEAMKPFVVEHGAERMKRLIDLLG